MNELKSSTKSDQNALDVLIAKDQIRELAMLYSRAADRHDSALMRSLYTKDAMDNHGSVYSGPIDGFIQFWEAGRGQAGYSGHFISNHLIAIENENEAYGEVYALAFHHMHDGDTAGIDDFMLVRYLDYYRREDGRWRFAKRDVMFDVRTQKPMPRPEAVFPDKDLSYSVLKSRLFAHGPRA